MNLSHCQKLWAFMLNYGLFYYQYSPNMVKSRYSSCKFQEMYILAYFSIKFYDKSPNLVKIGSRTKKLQANYKRQGGKHPFPVLTGLIYTKIMTIKNFRKICA